MGPSVKFVSCINGSFSKKEGGFANHHTFYLIFSVKPSLSKNHKKKQLYVWASKANAIWESMDSAAWLIWRIFESCLTIVAIVANRNNFPFSRRMTCWSPPASLEKPGQFSLRAAPIPAPTLSYLLIQSSTSPPIRQTKTMAKVKWTTPSVEVIWPASSWGSAMVFSQAWTRLTMSQGSITPTAKDGLLPRWNFGFPQHARN